jgi:NADH-quinone oxidoreductase subunit C
VSDVEEDSGPNQDSAIAGLTEAFSEAEFESSLGQSVFTVPREQLSEFAAAARDAGFDMCVDVTAVDYLKRIPRFDVVVNLVSLANKRRLRIRAGVPGDDPVAPTLTDVYPGTNFYEREVYDLLGIRFEGHPDLTRILLPDDWEGHPLRKDSSVGAVPVQFKSSNDVL